MTELPLPQGIYGWIAIAAFVFSAILFIKQNNIKQFKDANDELRKRVDDKDKELHDLQLQLNSFKEDLAGLKATIFEKDKQIAALSKVQVVQQSNPEVTAYMQDMRNFTTQVHQYMIDSTKTFEKILAK